MAGADHMPELSPVRRLRLVVISPKDVAVERDAVPGVVRALNRGVCADRGVHIDEYRWECDTYPAFRAEGFQQGVVGALLGLADAELVIATFWARLGTPDDKLGG
jgi:hypothetical protein